MGFFYPRIVDFSDKLSGFADLKSTVDRGSAEKFGPGSGLCMSRSSDYGSGQFSVCLVRYFGVSSTILFSVPSFYSTERCISLSQNYKHRQKYSALPGPSPPLCNVRFRQAQIVSGIIFNFGKRGGGSVCSFQNVKFFFLWYFNRSTEKYVVWYMYQ